MDHIFEITDKTGRKIRLTKKQWTHITSPTSPHAYMTNYLEEIKETLINPDKMVNSLSDDQKVNYYKYYKKRERYLKNIVNYLNGNGFVISAYFVKSIN
ncbi:hypothetical protein J4422_01905 [Candidatus Pacearchaeota archaeon]|nr:hypothetical protein [Candidatus Pacearchaeota archaeon]